ncbi:MAG: SH3 domain-containing protein [Lachnospiraceae bacterium]|nr:SH3 domain-containing protein [Lachnospiraceae bacterium]
MRYKGVRKSFIIIFVITAAVILFGAGMHARGESRTGTVTASVLNVRTGPGTNYTVAGKLSMGSTVTILADAGNGWYQISYVSAGSTVEGYVSQTYISVSGTDSSTTEGTESDAANFEAELSAQGFPESYKTYLRKLHQSYPNWRFVAVKTGLDWNTVIQNEKNVQGSIKNTVQGTSSAPHYNWRSTEVGYNWATDTWSVYDGSNWYAASKELIAYYMDPRNCLDANYIFEFESLNYVEGGQSIQGVESLLSGSFMANSVPAGSKVTYSQIMMNAGVASGVSPYHIASRIKQEVGNTIGTVTSGKNKTYPGIYNFYNIGAYDSAAGDAALNGLKWAAASGSYGRPWTTAEKSIVGGAGYIGASYINKGQNTLYFEKFNVVNTISGLYKHQYQTNVQAPSVEGYRIATAYANAGMKNGTITFNIPVYENMPDTRCVKPADSGNPNNWLKTLTVSGYTLTPTFAVNETNDYQLIVGADVSSIRVNAAPVNAKAGVSGAGTVKLEMGMNNIDIKVTAQNGNMRTYHITVVRGSAAGGTGQQMPEQNPQTGNIAYSGSYTVDSGICTGVATKTNVSTFISSLGAGAGSTVKICKADGITPVTANVGTGDVVVVTNGSTRQQFTVIIYGDVNGDGDITALDLLKVQKHITKTAMLTGASLQAANVKRSGNSVSALDLLKIQKHIIGAAKIVQ